jgi:REase_MTES_1575
MLCMDLEGRAWRENQELLDYLAKPSRQAGLVALASRQHAVFSLEQLLGLGWTKGAVFERALAAYLHRIHRTVYSLAPRELLSREGHFMAAVLACGPGAALSHRSVADLHGVRRDASTKIDVTVPGTSHRRHQGVRLHRSLTLTPDDVTIVNGIPCATVARMFIDIAEVLPQRALERALDQAEILELFDLWAIQEQLERNAARLGAKRLRATLDEHIPGSTPTWNDFEERFLALARSAGLPDPEVNAWIVVPDGEPAMRVDFVWRAGRLAVETDGRATHGTRQAFERDRRRDQRLTVARWRPVRVTWRQLTRSPAQVTETLLALLRPAVGAG